MFRAFSALRLGVQGALNSHNDGVTQKLNALITKLGPFNGPGGDFGVIEGESRPETVHVVSVTVH
jgi:hypothetical protein